MKRKTQDIVTLSRGQPAVFLIRNDFTGKVYVSASVDVRAALQRHFARLRAGKHVNKPLQKDFDEYGEDFFVWVILRECDRTDLAMFEEEHMEEYYKQGKTYYTQRAVMAARSRHGLRKAWDDPVEGKKRREKSRKTLAGIRSDPKLKAKCVQERTKAQQDTRYRADQSRATIARYKNGMSKARADAISILHTPTGKVYTTSTDAAKAAGVSPSTMRRWAVDEAYDFRRTEWQPLPKHETYDIAHVGENNRFFVRPAGGGDPICVHNCGYGMSPATFALNMQRQGMDEVAEQAEFLVGTYRQSYPAIPAFWRSCGQALDVMLNGSYMELGANGMFKADGRTEFFGQTTPTITLPDGFKLVYAGLEAEQRGKFLEYSYMQFKGRAGVKTKTYAAKVAENCIQALAFAVLKEQALRIMDRGVPIHLNIHDEWASVVPWDKVAPTAAVYHEEMSRSPAYLPQGLLTCEVDIGINYADLKVINIGKILGDKT